MLAAGQPDRQLLLKKPSPPAHDEATAEQIRQLVTKGAMGMARSSLSMTSGVIVT